MWFCIFLKEYYDYLFVYLDMGPGGGIIIWKFIVNKRGIKNGI